MIMITEANHSCGFLEEKQTATTKQQQQQTNHGERPTDLIRILGKH